MYIKIKGYYESIIDYFPEYSENPEYISILKGFYGTYFE